MILHYHPRTFGRRPGTTAKVVCNLATYALLRSARALQHDRVNSPWHWYRFPFSLRQDVLWSPTLQAWFCPADESAIECMLKMDHYKPVDWVNPKCGELFIDVGAYVGWYSIRASRLVGPSGQVLALEPDSRNRFQLEANVPLNQLKNVRVISSAAWSKSGRVRWHASSVPVWNSVSENADDIAFVEAIAIDDLVRDMKLHRVDWIKMDVEGGELGVLEGANETLRRFHPSLFIELHENFEPISSLLETYGYQVVHLAFDQEPQKHGWMLARREGPA